MLNVLRQTNFRRLWFGGLISMIGNWVLLAAMPFYVYELTGSALATGGILMAHVAPAAVLGSLAGVFVDRWDRRKTMLAISLMQALTVLGLLFVDSAENVWIIYVVVFIEASLGTFFSPAENALLPKLVGDEDLMAANSLNSLNDNLARLGGPALGGALLALTGFASVAVVDAASYLIAAILIFTMQVPQTDAQPVRQAESVGHLLGVWRDWVAGLKVVIGDRLLGPLFVVVALALFGDAIISAVLVVFIQDEMGLGPVEFGTMMTARGLGGLLGGLLAAYVGSKLSMGQIASGSLAAAGFSILIMVAFPSLAVVLPLLVAVGVISLIGFITIHTVMQLGTEDRFRGRVFGAFGTTVALLMFAGSGLGGALADSLGSANLMSAAGIIYIAAGVLAAAVLAAPLRDLQAKTATA
jgi:predicted MFS family arabinose efflux permease